MMADGSFYFGDMREDSVEGLGVYRPPPFPVLTGQASSLTPY